MADLFPNNLREVDMVFDWIGLPESKVLSILKFEQL